MEYKVNIDGIIYRATNEITGESYIGCTLYSLEKRKRDHLQKSKEGSGHQFQEAIGTYGPEAFSWSQLDSASTINELAKKEKEYILKYNSKEEGYNNTTGGDLQKNIFKYDLNTGELVSEFKTLTEAALTVNSTKQHISRACLSVNNVYMGFLWSYNTSDKFVPNKDRRRKEVIQLDLYDNLIAVFISVADASKQTGANKSSIAKCCRGERNSTGGFHWEYKD